MKNIALILVFAILLASCQGSKYFTKMGAKQEAAGLVTEAANSYFIALMKKRTNIEAQIGMKKTGQLTLNSLLNDFSRAKNFGTPKEAVYSFQTAKDYLDKIKGVGIELQLAEFYITDYQAAKDSYLSQLYDEGTSLMEAGKYNEAESSFNEIRELDPKYKDAQELGDIAFVQPLYDKGIQELNDKRYRAAYESFQKITERKTSFKDSKELIQQCIEKGRYTIALLPFENGTTTIGLDVKLSAYTLEALTSINDPFLRIVDRDHMNAILQEQKLQLSGVIDQATAVQVGELVGANAILTGTVLNYYSKTGTMRTKARDAYEAYSVKKLNPDDGKYYLETKYKPTTYTEYYNTSSSSLSFQYKLIELQTGEIIKTEIIDKSLTDEVLYAKYEGDSNNIYPAAQAGVNMNNNDRRTLIGLLSARQELRNAADLSNDLFNGVSSQMSKQIGLQVKEIVK